VSYLFDTNAIIHLMKLRDPLTSRAVTSDRRRSPSRRSRWQSFGSVRRDANAPRSRAEQDVALKPFRVLDFDAAAAAHYAAARAHLADRGRPFGDRDLMIASIALANG
jgi:predicted nucleic acid-binding protein